MCHRTFRWNDLPNKSCRKMSSWRSVLVSCLYICCTFGFCMNQCLHVSSVQLGVNIFLAIIVGAIFYGVKDDQSGIQNRYEESTLLVKIRGIRAEVPNIVQIDPSNSDFFVTQLLSYSGLLITLIVGILISRLQFLLCDISEYFYW